MTHVYVITARSESGDTYGPFVFEHTPTEDQKRNLIRGKCDWADEGGPGDYGSYTFLTVHRVAVEGEK